jgi:CubicO group peptidase (beta-lactamase class C family)
MKLFTLLFILILLVQPASVIAEPFPTEGFDFEGLDSYITAQMDKHGIRGISIAVVQGNETVYLKGYGTSGSGRPMTPQTPMYIGSTSKSFTGLAIAQLADGGKIDIRDPAQKYIPWFEVADKDASTKITISHLLHHTSGMSEAGFTARLPANVTREEAVRALESAKLTAEPGTEFQYFNMGYAVLALVVENASGQSYESYLQEHIFQPLGMINTFTDPQQAGDLGLSQGYTRLFGFTVPQNQPHRQYEVSAGYIISTAEDMARYTAAMKSNGEYNGERLLSSDGMRRLFFPVKGYGMGWFVENGHIYHGGANETFKSFLDIYPNRNLGFVLLINQGYMMDHYISAGQIYSGVENILLGKQPPPVSAGWSVRNIGFGLLGLVLALSILHLRSFIKLRGWREQAKQMTRTKLSIDVAINFIIPAVIFILIYTQLKGFFGYRFNLSYQMSLMFVTLMDISILMIVGLIPDLVQGLIKTFWVLTGQTRRISKGETILQPHPIE